MINLSYHQVYNSLKNSGDHCIFQYSCIFYYSKESDQGYGYNYRAIAHWMSVGIPVEVMETFLMSYSAAVGETRDDQVIVLN